MYYVVSWTYGQTGIRHILSRHQVYRQMDIQAGRYLVDRQQDRQAGRHIDRQTLDRQRIHTYSQYYRLFRQLAPTAQSHIPNLYILMIDLHADFQITNLIYLLHVMWFLSWIKCCCENILLYFWGCYNQNGHIIFNN